MRNSIRITLAGLVLLLSFLGGEAFAACNRAVPASGNWSATIQPDINEELGCLYDEVVTSLTGVTNSGNDYTASASPPLPYYKHGQMFQFTPNVANTGDSRIKINGLGFIQFVSNTGTALGANDLTPGSFYFFMYDGTDNQMQLLTPLGTGTAPANATYIVQSLSAGLSQERSLAAGALLGLTDGGANSTMTVAVTDAETLAIGGLTSAADKVPYFTGSGTAALADFSSAIRTLITTPSSANLRAMLSDEVGTGVLVFEGTPVDDAVSVGDSASGTTWRAIPDSDAAGVILGYDVTTNTFSTKADDDIPEAGDYTNLSATSPITQSGGTISTSIATNRLVGRSTAGTGVMEQITPDATLSLSAGSLSVVDLTCTNCIGPTEIADLTLGTDTAGNYQNGDTAGTGIAVSQTPAEGFSPTISFDFSDAGASPSLNADECRFTSNATAAGYIVCEGDTADTIETRIAITDPTVSDKTFTIPNANSVGVQGQDCGAGNVVRAIDPSTGAITCAADAGAAGGDSISINGSAATDADFDDTTPAAASGGVNVLWQKDAGTPNNVSAYVPNILGKRTIAIPAGAIKPRATNGCTTGTFSGTNVEAATCDFIDGATAKLAQFQIPQMPKSADESAGIEAAFTWTTSTASNAVVWGLKCVAISDDDVLDTAMGTEQQVTDTVTAANDEMITSYTSTITPGNTWTEGDALYCEVRRDSNNGSDTHTGTARLLGITIRYTINALRDN